MAEDSKGMIIRGEDGAIYFIRDEVLQACQVTDSDMAQFCAALLDEYSEVSGFSMSAGPAVQALAFEGPLQSAQLGGGGG